MIAYCGAIEHHTTSDNELLIGEERRVDAAARHARARETNVSTENKSEDEGMFFRNMRNGLIKKN